MAIDSILDRDRDVFLSQLPHEVEYLVRAVEAAGLRALGAHLIREAHKFGDPDEVKNMAGILMRVSDTRLEYLAGRRKSKPSDTQVHMTNDWDMLMWQITQPGLIPPEVLDPHVTRMTELLSYLDERASDGGITGEGWYRNLVKGT